MAEARAAKASRSDWIAGLLEDEAVLDGAAVCQAAFAAGYNYNHGVYNMALHETQQAIDEYVD